MSTQSDLTEALAARKALILGAAKVSVSFSSGAGGRSVTYTRASLAQLEAYIAELRRELNGVTQKRNRVTYMVPD